MNGNTPQTTAAGRLMLALPIVIGLLAVVVCWQTLSLGAATWQTQRAKSRAAELAQPRPNPGAEKPADHPAAKGVEAKAESKYLAIVKRGMFGRASIKGDSSQDSPRSGGHSKPSSSGSGSVKLTGILGDQAIVNDQLVSVGEKVGDATLVEISGDRIVLEKDGERTEVEVFAAKPGGAPTPPPAKTPEIKEEPKKPEEVKPETEEPAPALVADDALGGLRNRLEGILASEMSMEDIMQTMKGLEQEMESLTPEQKKQLESEFEERFKAKFQMH